jgi:hypothetical protein
MMEGKGNPAITRWFWCSPASTLLLVVVLLPVLPLCWDADVEVVVESWELRGGILLLSIQFQYLSWSQDALQGGNSRLRWLMLLMTAVE